MRNQHNRIEFLDSIRGLAALFVLLSHTAGAFAWPTTFRTIMDLPFICILFDGKAAVAMFFVLSGYVLSKPYVEIEVSCPPRKIFLPTFYLRRFIRIWPPWFFAFGASIFAKNFLFFQSTSQPAVSNWLAGFWHAKLTALDFVRQCLFVLHDPSRQLLNQDWSLGVELKGSLLIPLFVVFARRKYIPLILLFAMLFLFFIKTGQYYVSFIIGVVVAQYCSDCSAQLNGLSKLFRTLVFLSGLLLYQSNGVIYQLLSGSYLAYKYGWLLVALGCAVIIVSVFHSHFLRWVLSWQPIVFLGRISYSVYLLQFIIILCLLPPLVTTCNQLGVTQPWIIFPITLFASSFSTIALATVMYYFVELPVIDFSHWITKKIQHRFQT